MLAEMADILLFLIDLHEAHEFRNHAGRGITPRLSSQRARNDPPQDYSRKPETVWLHIDTYVGSERDILLLSSSRVIPAAADTNVCLNGSKYSLLDVIISPMSQELTARMMISADWTSLSVVFLLIPQKVLCVLIPSFLK